MYRLRIINNMSHDKNFNNFIISLCCAIFPVIPFAITDIYYAYNPYHCMNINVINNLNTQFWILINGYMSLSSILFISLIFTVIYDNNCRTLVHFFQNPLFIKSYLFLKIIFNISWTIIGSIIFSKVYNQCTSNIQFYIWFRITFMFGFIIMSFKNIKQYIIDTDDSQSLEETLRRPQNV